MQSLLPLGANNTAGSTITIRVNGLTRTFTLSANGRGVSGADHVRVIRSRNQNTARVILHVQGQLKAELAAGAPVNSAGEPTQVAIQITYQGVVYTSNQSVVYRNLRVGRFGQ